MLPFLFHFFFTPKMRRSRGARNPGDLISTIFIASLLTAVFGQPVAGTQQQADAQYTRKKLGQDQYAQRTCAKGGHDTAVVLRYGHGSTSFADSLCTVRARRSYSATEVR